MHVDIDQMRIAGDVERCGSAISVREKNRERERETERERERESDSDRERHRERDRERPVVAPLRRFFTDSITPAPWLIVTS